jgi:hypothetical protein
MTDRELFLGGCFCGGTFGTPLVLSLRLLLAVLDKSVSFTFVHIYNDKVSTNKYQLTSLLLNLRWWYNSEQGGVL